MPYYLFTYWIVLGSLLPCECIQSSVSWFLFRIPAFSGPRLEPCLACLASKGLDDAGIYHLSVYSGTIYFQFSWCMTMSLVSGTMVSSVFSRWFISALLGTGTHLVQSRTWTLKVPSLLDTVCLIFCSIDISLYFLSFFHFYCWNIGRIILLEIKSYVSLALSPCSIWTCPVNFLFFFVFFCFILLNSGTFYMIHIHLFIQYSLSISTLCISMTT